MNKQSTLVDFISDYIDGTFNVRPSMLDNIAMKVKIAVIELQKEKILPEMVIEFTSEDMKDEKRDHAGKLIYNYYRLPDDFYELYSNGPGFEVAGEETKQYDYVDYGRFLGIFNETSDRIFTIHRFNGEHGIRHRLIAVPFPEDDEIINITYYSNGINTRIADLTEDYYYPVLNHVLNQLGIKPKENYEDDVRKIKRNRQALSGQGAFHSNFSRTRPRFFGNHRTDTRSRS